MNILKETYNIFVIPKLVKTSDDLANPSVGIRSTIGIMTMISANGGEVTQAQVAVFVKFFFLFRDVSTWRTQSGLKTIASMQLNAILSFSLHKLRWRAR